MDILMKIMRERSERGRNVSLVTGSSDGVELRLVCPNSFETFSQFPATL